MLHTIVCPPARIVRALVSLIAISLASPALTQPPEQSLPLNRVVLFSSGVGYFEHRGPIEGDRQLTFSLKAADMNDLLKSLVVQDSGGGLVTAVNYDSPEPIGRTLDGFTINLNQSPSLAQIFQQLRGHLVEVLAAEKMTGAVVGVEARTIPAGQATLDIDVLNLRTERGLESVRIDAISRTRFLDPKVDREFQQALDLLAASHQSQQKPIRLQFRGQGRREVAAGYIQESPVWKTTYRVVLDGPAPPQLQGWAIVENTTGQPWRDVRLTLVSGRPISFLMDLYEPLYSPRPLVAPERHANLRPRIYEQDLTQPPVPPENAAAAADTFRRAGKSAGGGMFGAMGGGMGGGMAGMGRGSAGYGGAAMAPVGRGAQRPFVTTTVPAAAGATSLDLAKGVTAAAAAEEVGELFRYVMTSPVSLGPNESAMLPIVNDAVTGEKLAIYNPAVHAKHPLAGLRLSNTTEVHWMQGPITLFDGGEYAGDARIEDIPPGATRLISYALDLQTEVAVTTDEVISKIVHLKIQSGGLSVSTRATRDVHYVVKNASSKSRKLLIERPLDETWEPTAPQPAEKTRSLHRYELDVPANKSEYLTITEQQDQRERHMLADLAPERLRIYLDSVVIGPQLKKAIQDAIDRKTALAALTSQRAATERQVADITSDQSRLRSNLQSVAALGTDDPFAAPQPRQNREMAQRYLTKLDQQETELERLRDRVVELKFQEATGQQDLEHHLKNLTVDETRP